MCRCSQTSRPLMLIRYRWLATPNRNLSRLLWQVSPAKWTLTTYQRLKLQRKVKLCNLVKLRRLYLIILMARKQMMLKRWNKTSPLWNKTLRRSKLLLRRRKLTLQKAYRRRKRKYKMIKSIHRTLLMRMRQRFNSRLRKKMLTIMVLLHQSRTKPISLLRKNWPLKRNQRFKCTRRNYWLRSRIASSSQFSRISKTKLQKWNNSPSIMQLSPQTQTPRAKLMSRPSKRLCSESWQV